MKTFVRHPSVLKIKEYKTPENAFSFSPTTTQQFEIEIQQLDPKKASAENDIPKKVLIETSDVASHYLTKICNDSKNDHIFPESLKLVDVIPIHKKDESTTKENYRPVSLLPITSKLFGRDMYKQIYTGTLINTFSPIYSDSGKGTVPNSVLPSCLNNGKKLLTKKYMLVLF